MGEPDVPLLWKLLTGATTVLWLIGGAFVREHWTETKKNRERIEELERSQATRGDVDKLYDRINKLDEKMQSQHNHLLSVILGRRQ